MLTLESTCRNRRKAHRVYRRVAASYSQTGFDRFHTYALDISEKGARIVGGPDLKPGCFVTVQAGSSFRGRARVAWVVPLTEVRVVAGLQYL